MSYARFVSHHPVWVLVLVTLVSVACLVISILNGNYIDFSDPKAGFKTRGTVLSDRVRTYRRLLDDTGRDEQEITIPYELTKPRTATTYRLDGKEEDEKGNKSARFDRLYQWVDQQPSGFFYSEYPSEGTNLARLVYASRIPSRDLFSLPALRATCRLEQRLLNTSRFRRLCLKHAPPDSLKRHSQETLKNSRENCAPTWSLHNYVTLLSNKTSCQHLNKTDVQRTRRLLNQCKGYYLNYTLEYDCSGRCEGVPKKCTQFNAVYILLHFILDVGFLNDEKLTYMISFLPASTGQAMIPIYKDLVRKGLSSKYTEIVALNFGIKYMLFDHYLAVDTVWIAASAFAIFLSLWLYTSSLFVTVMTIFAVIFSLDIAYFLYTVIYGIHFFPFMNLLTLVIAIGIGADDVFVFCKLWHVSKLERNNGTLDKIVSNTLKHATLSMFVTSFTTAAAFFANFISDIIAIRCFAIYAGTVVLCNFALMVTWIPATVVIQEKWCSCCVFYAPDIYVHKPNKCYYACKFLHSTHKKLNETARIFFDKILPWIVIKLRYLWILIVLCLTFGGVLVVFYQPKLSLPSSNEFKVFVSTNLMEVYDAKIRDKFRFEKAAGFAMPVMPLTFVWGVIPRDDGERLDPRDRTTLKLDKSFNMASTESQLWLSRFCEKLKDMKYTSQGAALQVSNCFIDTFRHLYMDRSCDLNGQNLEPCCNKSTFPYPEPVFKECIRKFGPEVNRLTFSHPTAGPRYSKKNGQIIGLIVEFASNRSFTYSYPEMNQFYRYVNTWAERELANASAGLSRGWFTSEMEFYDLQNSLAVGTPIAIGVSVGVASLVVFFTTLNVLISICAVLSIISTISITVGALVLLGWELAILESTTISIAVGLSIDFTLHYGVAYRLSPDLDREMRIVSSIQSMGSAVALAAFTTLVAGALMLPSTVLAYQNIGTFMIIVMAVSWYCATFYFQSLLRILGPRGGFGQFHWPSCDCCSSHGRERVDKTVYSMTESTMSSSSNHYSTEMHELEHLKPNNRRRSSRKASQNSLVDHVRYMRTANHNNCSKTVSVSTVVTSCDEGVVNHRSPGGGKDDSAVWEEKAFLQKEEEETSA